MIVLKSAVDKPVNQLVKKPSNDIAWKHNFENLCTLLSQRQMH